jgi:hypothetical protein
MSAPAPRLLGTCDAVALADLMLQPFPEDMLQKLHPTGRAMISVLWPQVAELRASYQAGAVVILCAEPEGLWMKAWAGLYTPETAAAELARLGAPATITRHVHAQQPDTLLVLISHPDFLSAVTLTRGDGKVLDLSPAP